MENKTEIKDKSESEFNTLLKSILKNNNVNLEAISTEAAIKSYSEFHTERTGILTRRQLMFEEIIKHLQRPPTDPDLDLNDEPKFIHIKNEWCEVMPEYGSLYISIPFWWQDLQNIKNEVEKKLDPHSYKEKQKLIKANKISYPPLIEISYSLYITGSFLRVGFFVKDEWATINQKVFSEWFLKGIKQIWFNREPTFDIRNGNILTEWTFDFTGKDFAKNYNLQETLILNMRHMHMRIAESAYLYTKLRIERPHYDDIYLDTLNEAEKLQDVDLADEDYYDDFDN